ncbi:hypothetical protein N9S30_00285 [bacterium]|nr:hypothetical protein [bacterium]
MENTVRAFYADLDAAKDVKMAKQRLQPTSTHAVIPTAAEEAGSDDPSVTSPCCPHCGNLDVRGLLDDPSALATIHAQTGRQGQPPAPFTVPTSITADLKEGAPSYPSLSSMVCLACDKGFSYRADVWMMSGEGPLNMKRASLAFLTRTLYDGEA